MIPSEPCAYCGRLNLTWLHDGTPVCGEHYLETHGKTSEDGVVPRLRSRRRRLRISPAAAQLLREAAE